MTHSYLLVQVGLKIGRWLLPWVAVVFASATLAYAINGAIAGDPSPGDHRPAVQVAVSTLSVSAPSVDLGPSITPERCAPIGVGYVDSSIVAETRRIACGHGAP